MNSGKPGVGEEWSSQGKILDEQMESWPKKVLKLQLSLILKSQKPGFLRPEGINAVLRS